jgi:hypothetical protein
MYNYSLTEGDVITVSKVIDYVSIYGSGIQYIENQITLDTLTDVVVMNSPFINGKRAGYYIRNFGNGFTPDAWRSKTFVVETNGRVRRTVNLYVVRIYPKVNKGSSIYVNSKVKKGEVNRIPTDWNKVISDITVKLTGLATIWALLTR